MNKIKKILITSEKFNQAVRLNKIAFLPLVGAGVAGSLKAIGAYIGIVWAVSGVAQSVSEEMKRCDSLIDSAKEIIEQLTEYKEDYGFGDIAKEADQLLSDLKTMVDLYPSVSETITEKNPNSTKSEEKQQDLIKFLTALANSEQNVSLVNSYLQENRGMGTKFVEVLRGTGTSFGFETDTISAIRALNDFYMYAGAQRVRLERSLKAIADKAAAAQKNQIAKKQPKSMQHSPQQVNTPESTDDSDFEQFADITF